MIPSKEVKEKIEERYKNHPQSSPDKFIRENEDVKNYLEALIAEDSWFHNLHDAFYMAARGIYTRAKCVVCGKDLAIEKIKNNVFTCSRVCGGKNPARLEKVKKTTLERYGVDNAAKSKEIQNKMKKTCMERYGVENAFQSEEKKEKIKETCLKKYGVQYASQSKEIKDRMKKTNLERYGVEYSIQSKEIQEKCKKTNLKKFGVEHPAQNIEVVNKMKQTCLDKYGVECTFKVPEIAAKREKTWNEKYGGNPLKSPDVINKRYITCIKKYGNKYYVNSSEYMSKEYDKIVKRFEGKVIPLFTREEYHGINCKEVYKWKCVKCGNEFEDRIYTTSIDEDPLLPRCLICHPYMTGESQSELEVLDFIRSIYNGEIKHGDRTIIKARNEFESSKELDIYLPEKNIAIEFDGLFWHSESVLELRNVNIDAKNYHLMKTESCEEQGIQLIHIFEDEWKMKKEIVKDRIKSILGIDRIMIFARKCMVKEIDSKISNEFLICNHIQGGDNSKYHYGLYYNDELVAVMTFGKPRFNKNYDYELIRFASKIGYQIVGGASKLLKYFRTLYQGSIISYADRRYSNGKLYKALGFELTGSSNPNYCYFKNNIKLNRYQCQKYKLKKLLGEENFDENLSEYENMTNNGFSRVYDCGNLVFILK